ncbi:MAG TPA: hypothetical protein VNL14_16145 [Candidatus Acidoferrales bacterium]|nr:hypothetical protein [Candidatus Acidoferrales bacterium]
MKTAAAIFTARGEAERAASRLRDLGVPPNDISLLTPETSAAELAAVPTTDAEQPGMGKVIGGVVGAAAGLSGGVQLGALAGVISLPGIGPIAAVGFAGALLAGAAGAAAGGALEDALREGVPTDEIYFYEDALKKGRSVVIFQTDDPQTLKAGRAALLESGAESLDAAREEWWIGLRDAEEAEYDAREKSFREVEPTYRKGFEAALERPVRGKAYAEAADHLKRRYPEIYRSEEFRRGYERGLQHWQSQSKK